MKTKTIFAVAFMAALLISCDTDTSGLETKQSENPAEQPTEGLEFTLNNAGTQVKFLMKKVEAGDFMMGSSDDGPMHKVTLTNTYYIGETEVTRELWRFVMGSLPSNNTSSLSESHPVEVANYDECLSFINRLNELTKGQRTEGRVFRLPTEAEWEYAAKGGKKSHGYTYAGSNDVGEVANYSESSTNTIKSKKANELGIYDMSGNVREWCHDYYANYTSEPQTDPQGPSTGKKRVYRGGCYSQGESECVVTKRKYSDSNIFYTGLRVVLGKELSTEQDPEPTTNESIAFSLTNYGKTVNFNLVKVENGSFTMGDGTSSAVKHRVTLTKTFYMGETEVSQALWEAVMGTLPTGLYNYGDNYPVYDISHDDCISFVTKLNEITASKRTSGQKFYIPTEAEWEFAARGGNLSKNYKYSGSNTVSDVASCYESYFSSTNYKGYISTSKSKQPNELGIYDMTGNVWEWCLDWYAAYPTEAQTDPTGPETGKYKIHRGGGSDYYHNESYFDTTSRGYSSPTSTSYFDSPSSGEKGSKGLRILLK